jgi:hypothetical protein
MMRLLKDKKHEKHSQKSEISSSQALPQIECDRYLGEALALGVGVARECLLVFFKRLRVFCDAFFALEAFLLRTIVVVVTLC